MRRRPAAPTAAWTPLLANEATDELAAALTILCKRMSVLVPRSLQTLRRTWQSRQPADEENTPTGARENIHRHYDLSNDLFETFLDPSLTYSAGWFEPGDDLVSAQHRKIDGILDLARVKPGMRVLEIGSGWGGLAIRAVQERNVHVTTLTLSEAQKELADRRIAEAGLSDRIEVLLEDYRHHADRAVGTVRRRRQRRDDRGGRRAVLAGLLRRGRPDAGRRWPDEPAGDHHGP